MDLNQSVDFPFSSPPSPQLQNVMPLASFMLPNHHQTSKRNILEFFWNQQLVEIYNTSVCKSHHQLPLARIKRIMKSDGKVKMISADTPAIFSKACELFILELTLRAWLQTEECKRRTLQRCDIATAISHDDLLDFLVDLVPLDRDHHYYKENGTGKNLEQTLSGSAESLHHHPMMINIGESAPEVPWPYMIDPSMCCADLDRSMILLPSDKSM
ncbi:nuclear transcription factor Y subunit C-2-like [Corylus avellana]|uniref:nuclear transcription factor Y subunit C-2-like n=1 Tax=Corylus avellana TaxID=13451 RepID=UPI00286B029C|nr:nuclear transcription factor Y subunit C-2-like [Corylus avellana]